MSLKCTLTSGISCGGLLQVSRQRLIRSTDLHGTSVRVHLSVDPEDVAALRRAKEGELVAKKTGHISERAISARITQRELALHCRRRTRGVEETTRLIGALIDLFDSAEGKDTLGFLSDPNGSSRYGRNSRNMYSVFKTQRTFRCTLRRGH
ncbi:hypothetical protein QQF64_031947 [Cirrhinus molitorella]|uniref:Uncharacterized protein n=1 Tax=Cirrhinus molitorella TaxID=172907 RepID=A0ABR3MYD7_9TELE